MSNLDIASKLWEGGEPLKAGQLVNEALSPAVKPAWALEILRLAYDRAYVEHQDVKELLDLSEASVNWLQAKRISMSIRHGILHLENKWFRSKSQELQLCLLYVAENAGKVIYNSVPAIQDPFDDDVGVWVVKCLWDFATELGCPDFEFKARKVAFRMAP